MNEADADVINVPTERSEAEFNRRHKLIAAVDMCHVDHQLS